jgi:hypothetical protein
MHPEPALEEAGTSKRPVAHTVENFEGRFRAIPTIQLCLVWWLYRESHISRRQLRVYFALHEMAERRRYTKAEEGGQKRQPFYTASELASLVGGRGDEKSETALKADVRTLAKIGLIRMSQQQIAFALSPDQINVIDLTAFWTFWNQIPNRRRTVPVPRRTLRALAAGFSKAVTGVLIAMMIRSLHWHKREGDFRVDGRTKGSWIADVFGLSRRAVTDARAHLIALAWLEPQKTTQSLLNRYGNHDKINVAWSHKVPGRPAKDDLDSASPSAEKPRGFATPLKTENLSSNEEDLKNKKPETVAVPGPQLLGSRNKNAVGVPAAPKPRQKGKSNLRAIAVGELSDTNVLFELHRQAVEVGLSDDSEASLIAFFALAERARSRGNKPQALFTWLLQNRKFEFITQADEDAAMRRIKEHRFPPQPRVGDPTNETTSQNTFTEDDRVVRICHNIARKHNIAEPFAIARRTKQWTREQWNLACENFELRFGSLR